MSDNLQLLRQDFYDICVTTLSVVLTTESGCRYPDKFVQIFTSRHPEKFVQTFTSLCPARCSRPKKWCFLDCWFCKRGVLLGPWVALGSLTEPGLGKSLLS